MTQAELETAYETGLSAPSLIKKHAAVVFTFILFVAGAYALYRLLTPLNLRDVLATLRTIPITTYLAAIAATALGHVGLIGYDWSALRLIGKRLPLPVVALGGFLGYAFGNTIGLSAISGGAVRYRIYSALGLDGYDVAAVASFAAISYGVGATMIGLGALAIHPEALTGITSIAPASLRLWSLVVLAASIMALALLALRGGTVRVKRLAMRVPNGAELVYQFAFTFVEICMAALVLHIFLPPGSLPFANLLVVYAIATMAGVASHVPGGVGVFESVVIGALPGTVPLDQAVSALLLFRLVYFLLPFLIALASLSAMEMWSRRKRAAAAPTLLTPLLEAGRGLAPTAIGSLVLASGLFMMFAGLLPNPAATADELEAFLPLAMIEGGALVSSILGAFLVVLSISLFRKSRLAFWIVLGLLALGILTALLKTRDIDRVLILGFLLLIFLPYRTVFDRTARIAQGLWSAQWIGMIVAALASLGLIWFLVHENVAPTGTMWWQFGEELPALTAGRAGIAAAVVLSLGLMASALGRGRVTLREPDAEALADAARIIATHGGGGDMLALTGDKMLMFAPDGDAVLSYAVKGASWIALGAPVGAAAARADLAWAFHDAARGEGARPVFYETPPDFIETAIDMGLTPHKMGEEALVDLADFSLEGPARKKLRTVHSRAGRDGLSLEVLAPPHSGAFIAELKAVSDVWLQVKTGREKRFSVGRFEAGWLNRCRIATVLHGGRIVAFANLLEAGPGGSVAVDLMRQTDDGPANTMEFLFTATMLHLKAEGAPEFSLGMVPFAGVGADRRVNLWSRFGAVVYQRGERFYEFEGLRRFKDKFDPRWRPRYLCCRTVLPPVAPLSDAARLIAGSARGIIGK